jgi:hypothetical protein
MSEREMPDPERPGVWFEIEHRRPGYAHVTIAGRCGPDTTKEDVERRFYHPYFGGRGAFARDGFFGATIHTD